MTTLTFGADDVNKVLHKPDIDTETYRPAMLASTYSKLNVN